MTRDEIRAAVQIVDEKTNDVSTSEQDDPRECPDCWEVIGRCACQSN